MKTYILRLETNRLVTCQGVSGPDAARRYVLIHPDAVIEAWSEVVSMYQCIRLIDKTCAKQWRTS
jgi:hypothetical protein